MTALWGVVVLIPITGDVSPILPARGYVPNALWKDHWPGEIFRLISYIVTHSHPHPHSLGFSRYVASSLLKVGSGSTSKTGYSAVFAAFSKIKYPKLCRLQYFMLESKTRISFASTP